MKTRLLSCCVSLLLVVGAASSSFGQSTPKSDLMTHEQIRARVAEAHAKDKRLIVRFKNGETMSGVVSPVSNTSFSLTKTHGIFGDGQSVTINYADVASVKGRNPFVKALKDVGAVSVVSIGVAVVLPVWAALEGLSLLLNGEPLPSCSTRD